MIIYDTFRINETDKPDIRIPLELIQKAVKVKINQPSSKKPQIGLLNNSESSVHCIHIMLNDPITPNLQVSTLDTRMSLNQSKNKGYIDKEHSISLQTVRNLEMGDKIYGQIKRLPRI